MLEIKKILVPIDFSEYSLQALEYAKILAEKFEAEVILLKIVEPITFISDITMSQINIPSIEKEFLQKAKEKITEITSILKDKYKVTSVVKLGKPYAEIVEFARSENVDLIVIGSHGHAGVEHILFGSTTEKVIRKANCPVLIIKSKQSKKC